MQSQFSTFTIAKSFRLLLFIGLRSLSKPDQLVQPLPTEAFLYRGAGPNHSMLGKA